MLGFEAKLWQAADKLRNNLYLKAIFSEGELAAGATIKSYLMVAPDGSRSVSRAVLHYLHVHPERRRKACA